MENTGELDDSVSELKSLLQQVQGIKAKNDAVIEATGGKYNLFRELGIGHDELIFSKMIASLLKANGSHGFKEEFLKSFINNLPIENLPQNLQFDKATVDIEKDIGERNDKEVSGERIDIFIKIPDESNTPYAFIIENKIYADDQNKQLLRYRNFAQKNYPDHYFLLYLTLNGKNPSLKSVEKDCPKENRDDIFTDEKLKDGSEPFWINISYSEHIKSWIESCAMQAIRFPLLRETLQSFCNQLNRLTGQDLTKMNEQEIITLLSKNLAEAGIIYSKTEKAMLTAVKQNFERFYEKVKEKGLTEKKFINESKAFASRSYKEFGFYIWKPEWKLQLGFSFQGSGLTKFKYGIYIPHKNGVSCISEDENTLRECIKTEIDIKEGEFSPYWLVKKYPSEWSNWTAGKIKNADNKKLQDFLVECVEKLMPVMKVLEEKYRNLIENA